MNIFKAGDTIKVNFQNAEEGTIVAVDGNECTVSWGRSRTTFTWHCQTLLRASIKTLVVILV